MGLLDKVKNLFTEEVDVEVEDVKPVKKPKKEKKEKIKREKREEKHEDIQKEVIKVEIPSPEQTRTTRSQMNTYDDTLEKEDDYKFPFFDDDDFDVVETKQVPKKEEKVHKTEIYNPQKEEKKVFTPSPIISPVYGFLDKDYQKEEIVKNKERRRATVDEIRNKAYGGLESDIETTLFGENRMTFDDKEDTKELDKVDRQLKKIEKEVDKIEKPRHSKEDDLTDLLEAEMAKPEKEEKKKPRKISDKELFNLIDSMYEGDAK